MWGFLFGEGSLFVVNLLRGLWMLEVSVVEFDFVSS